MSVMNAFINGGELMKDLSPFVNTTYGRGVDYARYSITRYPGKGSGYTHIFSGYSHFNKELWNSSNIIITIPESYQIDIDTTVTFVVKEDSKYSSYSTQNCNIINSKKAIQFRLFNFQGFIFLSFLCYK